MILRVGNAGVGLVFRTLALYCSLLELCGPSRFFNATRLLFPIATGALPKRSILFFTEGTVTTTLCSSEPKTV
jgi:hypothetical protein